jgi:hypothetical protein
MCLDGAGLSAIEPNEYRRRFNKRVVQVRGGNSAHVPAEPALLPPLSLHCHVGVDVPPSSATLSPIHSQLVFRRGSRMRTSSALSLAGHSSMTLMGRGVSGMSLGGGYGEGDSDDPPSAARPAVAARP